MTNHEFTLFADYNQFYLQDEAATGYLGDAWDDEATKRMLATTDGAIGVGTMRNTEVFVHIEVHGSPPQTDLGRWDHVIECPLDVPSGVIVVAGCTDYVPDAARINVSPGHYRARVLYGNLGQVAEDGLSGNDHYHILLWKSDDVSIETLKAFSS